MFDQHDGEVEDRTGTALSSKSDERVISQSRYIPERDGEVLSLCLMDCEVRSFLDGSNSAMDQHKTE